MVWETRRSEADRLTDRLAARRQRAECVRRLVNDDDTLPDLAREIVTARMRRVRAKQSPGYMRIARRGSKLRIVIDLAKLNPQGDTLVQLLVRNGAN